MTPVTRIVAGPREPPTAEVGYEEGQTQPRVRAAVRVAEQKRSEMASWALSGCGHISQAPSATSGRVVVSTGVLVMMQNLTEPE